MIGKTSSAGVSEAECRPSDQGSLRDEYPVTIVRVCDAEPGKPLVFVHLSVFMLMQKIGTPASVGEEDGGKV